VTALVAAILMVIAGAAGTALASSRATNSTITSGTVTDGTVTHSTVTHSTAALTVNWYESAPYYSVLDSDAPDLGQVMSATGQKAFDLAFILADNGSCEPAWNDTDPRTTSASNCWTRRRAWASPRTTTRSCRSTVVSAVGPRR
jgi:chitinase